VSTGIGDTLREERERQDRTLEDVALSMRLRGEQLRALEEERFADFGGDVYARGFLKSYAKELGLDPEPLLETYRREVSDPTLAAPLVQPGTTSMRPRRSPPPAWVAWLLATVVILVGLGLIGQFVGGRAPETASPDPEPAPSAPADTEDEDDEGQEPAAEEEPEPEETFDGVDVLLALEEDSWMRVTVDGTVVFEQVATSGETLPFEGDEEVTVRFGNAGGVRVELNGEDLGAPGARGDVVEVSYSPDGPDA
jgi:cytoskeleton protein RodZ